MFFLEIINSKYYKSEDLLFKLYIRNKNSLNNTLIIYKNNNFLNKLTIKNKILLNTIKTL